MIAFTVEGIPATKGSFKAHRVGNGKIIVRNDNARTKPWQDAVGWKARIAMKGLEPFTVPVIVRVAFYLERPKSTKLATPRQDIDKLERALLDGMTGIVYTDDSLVSDVVKRKRWRDRPGVEVEIEAATL